MRALALVLANSVLLRITPWVLISIVQVATALTALWVRIQVIFMNRQKAASVRRIAKAKADAAAAAAKQRDDAKQGEELQTQQEVNDALEIEHTGCVYEKIRHSWHQRFVVLQHGTVNFYRIRYLHWSEGSYKWVSRVGMTFLSSHM